MPVVRSANEILHPRVVGVILQIHLQVCQHGGERLEVGEQAFLGPFLFQFRLRVADQLLDVEDASYACLDLILQMYVSIFVAKINIFVWC